MRQSRRAPWWLRRFTCFVIGHDVPLVAWTGQCWESGRCDRCGKLVSA